MPRHNARKRYFPPGHTNSLGGRRLFYSQTAVLACTVFTLFKDDRYFLSGSLDGKIRLWNIPDKKVALWNELEGAG